MELSVNLVLTVILYDKKNYSLGESCEMHFANVNYVERKMKVTSFQRINFLIHMVPIIKFIVVIKKLQLCNKDSVNLSCPLY